LESRLHHDTFKDPNHVVPALLCFILIADEVVIKPQFTNQNLLFYSAIVISCVSLAYLGFQFFSKSSFWEDLLKPGPVKCEFLLATVILCIGCFLRLWNIWNAEGGFMWDSAYKGLDGIAIREFGERPIFLDWNAGREALIAYLVAGSQMIFGTSVAAVRIVIAIAGCVTLLFFYLFLRVTLNSNVALLSTFLLSVSKWHIIHSRYGLRIPLALMFELAALYFIARAFQSGKTRWFLLAGITVGLGFYSYIAYRMFPFILLVFILNSPWRNQLRVHWKKIAAATLLAVIVLTPLALFSIENYERFTDRIKRTAVWSAAGVKEPASTMILKSTGATLGMFTYRGDRIIKHNVNSEPMLSPWICSFFILGLVMSIANITQPYALFWLMFLILNLIPGFLTVQAPHSARTLASVAPTMLFAAIGLLGILQIVSPFHRTIKIVFLAVVLGGCAYTGINDALFRQIRDLEIASARDASNWGQDRDQYEVAMLLNKLGTHCEAFLSPQLFFHATIEYLTYHKSSHQLFSNLKTLEKPKYRHKIRMVFLIKDQLDAWWLRDDEGKNFFKWWQHAHGMNPKQIRATIFKTYRKTTRTDDLRLLKMLSMLYPEGKILDFGVIIIFVVH